MVNYSCSPIELLRFARREMFGELHSTFRYFDISTNKRFSMMMGSIGPPLLVPLSQRVTLFNTNTSHNLWQPFTHMAT